MELHVARGERNDARIARATALAVHVLSQTSSEVTASIPTSQAGEWPVSLLAPALGVRDRIELHSFRCLRDVGSDMLVLDPLQLPTPAEVLADLGQTGAPPHDCSEALAKSRIAIVTNIPTHYRVALFNEMNAMLVQHEALLNIFFLSAVPRDRAWIVSDEISFEHNFLKGIDLGRARGRRVVPVGLRRPIEAFSPTVLLVAGFSPWVAMRLVGSWRGRSRPAVGIWSGEIRTRSTAKSKLRKIQRRALLKRADFAVAYGWESAGYLSDLDSMLPVSIGRNTTPVLSLGPALPRLATDFVEVITVARAERGKALELLIDAAPDLAELQWRLSIVGDGPELAALKARARGLSNVRFLGALHPHDVARELRRSDVFLFPSRYDIFGLVLVEAMGAGLAVATACTPGALADLCAPGRNCLVVKDATPRAWSGAMRRLITDRELRRQLGEDAQRTIDERWTIAHSASAMIAGLTVGLRAGERR